MERQFSFGLFLWNSKARYIFFQGIPTHLKPRLYIKLKPRGQLLKTGSATCFRLFPGLKCALMIMCSIDFPWASSVLQCRGERWSPAPGSRTPRPCRPGRARQYPSFNQCSESRKASNVRNFLVPMNPETLLRENNVLSTFKIWRAGHTES
jgi:hypothetical protein